MTGSTVVISASEADSVKSWLRTALVASSGTKALLYENDFVQISSITDYRAHQGRVAIVLYNISDKPFNDVSIRCNVSMIKSRVTFISLGEN
jgi:hypothetical protein